MVGSVINLTGKRVLITGAARGLGRAFAEAAVVAGARLVLCDIQETELDETVSTLSKLHPDADIHGCRVDLGDADSITRCAEFSTDKLDGIDALINNAAIATGIGGKLMQDIDIETWDRVMQVNVRGTWLMSRACLSSLRAATNGKIVNVASDTALWGAPRLMHYVGAKGAVLAMTRAMARELGPDNIAVNAIAPGLVLTESTDYVPEERKQHYVDGRAIPRTQHPEDVVGATLFLVSDAANFVTGQTLPVNGGFVFN